MSGNLADEGMQNPAPLPQFGTTRRAIKASQFLVELSEPSVKTAMSPSANLAFHTFIGISQGFP